MTTSDSLTARKDATPEQQRQTEDALQRDAARLLSIKRQMSALEAEADALTQRIKGGLRAGYRFTVDDMRPVLRPSRKRTLDWRDFRDTFGQKLLAQVLSVNIKAVDQLVSDGVIKKADVQKITTQVEGTPSLHWVATRPGAGENHAPDRD